MPKRLRTKDSEYLRFRPYRAFTDRPATSPISEWKKWAVRGGMILAAALVILMTYIYLHSQTW